MEGNEPSPRRMKTFYIIWLGELISFLGSGLTSFALGVWIFQKTGRATPFALTVLFMFLPNLLLAPLAGSLADRWNRRWLMIMGDTGSALTTLIIALLLAFDRLDVGHIYVLVFVSAAFNTFQETAYNASVNSLVPKKDLARAGGMMQMSLSIGNLAAPVLAGGLFLWIGLRGIVLIDFITYFAAVGALLAVRIPQPEVVEESGAAAGQGSFSVFHDARFGWLYLWQRNGLFWLLWYFALVNFLLNVAGVLEGPLVLSFANAAMYGIVETATGAGMLLGSILISAWGGPKRRVPVVIGFITLAAIGMVITGLRSAVVFPAVGMFIMLFFIPQASAMNQALFQSKIAPGVQGRVYAIRLLISRSMIPLGYLLAGPLADYIFSPLLIEGGALARGPVGQLIGVGPGRGAGLIFILSGILLAIVSGLAYLTPRIRNLEQELGDEVNSQTAIDLAVDPDAALSSSLERRS